MAQKAKEPTPIQKAATAARARLKAAREAHKDPNNEKTAKALADAKAAGKVAFEAENRERFERLGGIRVSNAVMAIRSVKGLSNRASFNYTADDISKAKAAIMAEVKATFDHFDAVLSAPATTEAKKAGGPVFKF